MARIVINGAVGGATGNRRYSNAPAVAEVTAADGCSGSKWATARHRTR